MWHKKNVQWNSQTHFESLEKTYGCQKVLQSLQNHGSLTWLCLFPPIFPICHTNPDPAADGGRQDVRLNKSETGLKASIQENRRLRFLNMSLLMQLKLALSAFPIHCQTCLAFIKSHHEWRSIKKSYLADFFVKLLLKTSQALEGADVKPNTTGEGREDKQRALALLLALLSLIPCHG